MAKKSPIFTWDNLGPLCRQLILTAAGAKHRRQSNERTHEIPHRLLEIRPHPLPGRLKLLATH